MSTSYDELEDSIPWQDKRLAPDEHIFLNHDKQPFSPAQERGLWRAYSGMAAMAVQFNGQIWFDSPIGFCILAPNAESAQHIADGINCNEVSLRAGTENVYDLEDIEW